ncbi:MAG: hypothetical protein JSS75_10690 [Bacteroidetes bacterium]|nr:hypothetical protein [Bacteroidota bacterium]
MNRIPTYCLFLLLVLSGTEKLLAQPYNWHPTTIPVTGSIRSMYVDGQSMVISKYYGGSVFSADGGATWSNTTPQINAGSGFIKSGNSILSSGSQRLLRSDDGGRTWREIDTATFNHHQPGAITVSGSNIIVADEFGSGVVVSSNAGTTWTIVMAGLASSAVTCLASLGTSRFAGTTYDGIYRSTDNGMSWSLAGATLRHSAIIDMTTLGSDLFAATAQGIVRSTDFGTSWQSTGLTNVVVLRLYAVGASLYASLPNGGVLISNDNGQTWGATRLGDAIVHGFASSGQTVYAGSQMDGYYSSTDNGNTWTQHGYEAIQPRTIRLERSGRTMFVGTGNSAYATGIYRSSDAGDHWVHCDSGMITSATGRPVVYDIMPLGNVVLAGTDQGLFRSTDSGRSWSQSTAFALNATVESIRGNRDTIYASVGDIFRSFDLGLTWQPMHCGFVSSAMKVDGRNIGALVGWQTRDELIVSRDLGATWDSSFLSRNVSSYCFTSNPSTVLIGADFYEIGNDMGNLYPFLSRSIDNGTTWNSSISFFDVGWMKVFESVGTTVFADTARVYHNDALIYSKDDGQTWFNAGLSEKALRLFDHNSDLLVAAGDSIFRTTFADTLSGVAQSGDAGGLRVFAHSGGHGEVDLEYHASQPLSADITITDLLGKVLLSTSDDDHTIGQRQHRYVLSSSSAGVLFVSVNIAGVSGTAKVIVAN